MTTRPETRIRPASFVPISVRPAAPVVVKLSGDSRRVSVNRTCIANKSRGDRIRSDQSSLERLQDAAPESGSQLMAASPIESQPSPAMTEARPASDGYAPSAPTATLPRSRSVVRGADSRAESNVSFTPGDTRSASVMNAATPRAPGTGTEYHHPPGTASSSSRRDQCGPPSASRKVPTIPTRRSSRNLGAGRPGWE